jgi:uncharacterized membrane protein YbhN (UPF0104 family)
MSSIKSIVGEHGSQCFNGYALLCQKFGGLLGWSSSGAAHSRYCRHSGDSGLVRIRRKNPHPILANADVGLIAFTGMAFAVFRNVDYLANATHVAAPVCWVALFVCVVPLVFWRTTRRLVSHFRVFSDARLERAGTLKRPHQSRMLCDFFLISGGIIFVLLLTLEPSVTLNFLNVVSIAALAWVLGFVVPGSPGGLGVREAVLVFVSSWSAGAVPMSLIAIAYRGVTLLGDLWFFLICTFAARLVQRRVA